MALPFGIATWSVRQAMQQVVSELSGPVVLSDRAVARSPGLRAPNAGSRRPAGETPRPPSCRQSSACPRRRSRACCAPSERRVGLDEPTSADAGDGMTVGELVVDPPAQEAYDRTCEPVTAAELPRLLLHLTARERNVI